MTQDDLKSDNVHLSNKLVAKLCDFSVVKDINPPSAYNNFVGLVVINDSYHTPASGILLFGLLLCHLITELSPYDWHTTEEMRTNLSESEQLQHFYTTMFSNEPIAIIQLAMSCLAKDQSKRPSSFQVCGMITSIITGKLKQSITLYVINFTKLSIYTLSLKFILLDFHYLEEQINQLAKL